MDLFERVRYVYGPLYAFESIGSEMRTRDKFKNQDESVGQV